VSIGALVDLTLFFVAVAFYIETRWKLGANLNFWCDQQVGDRRSLLSKVLTISANAV
jgi:hypothetical protein